jgi:RNA polymerase sigma-70 factor (ECF subfamily)
MALPNFGFLFRGADGDDSGTKRPGGAHGRARKTEARSDTSRTPTGGNSPMNEDADDRRTSSGVDSQARDALLMRHLRNSDPQALETLMQLYATPLGAVAYAVLGTNDFVEDVLQDVFVQMWERRASIEIHANVAGYLYRAVRNRAQNVLRHEQTQQRVERTMLREPDFRRATSNAGEQVLEEADFKAQVYAALRHVPESPREVFLLRWEQELSYDEIATMTGKTLPSVRVLMTRATKRLARYFQRRFWR